MKPIGSSHAKVEERQAKVLTLTLRGYSQTAIAKELGVTQQIVSLDLKTVRGQITIIQDRLRIHIFQDSYLRKQDMLCELWRMAKNARKDFYLTLAIFDRINKLDHEIDNIFLARESYGDVTSEPNSFRKKVVSGMQNVEIKHSASKT